MYGMYRMNRSRYLVVGSTIFPFSCQSFYRQRRNINGMKDGKGGRGGYENGNRLLIFDDLHRN